MNVFGRAVGRWFLPFVVGTELVSGGTAIAQYSRGDIGQREFYQRTIGPKILVAFTTGGAIIGGIVGFSSSGVGVVPGVVTGAKLGVLVAIPFRDVGVWSLNWYYQEFDEMQRAAVDRAVEQYYQLPTK